MVNVCADYANQVHLGGVCWHAFGRLIRNAKRCVQVDRMEQTECSSNPPECISYRSASLRATQSAAESTRASSAKRPTTCSPTGNPFGPVPALTVMQGV